MNGKTFKVGVAVILMGMSAPLLAANSYDYAGSCPKNGGKGFVDKWSFYQCECTSYAADKLNEKGVKFNNTYKMPSGKRWSNASNWVSAAKTAGISYNTTPKRGDIAWFSYGHVAYVESVDSSNNVTISEYNYSPAYSYGSRTLKKGTSSYPAYFIHL